MAAMDGPKVSGACYAAVVDGVFPLLNWIFIIARTGLPHLIILREFGYVFLLSDLGLILVIFLEVVLLS